MNQPIEIAPLEHTPFHPRLAAACETTDWYRWKGYAAVARYTEIAYEYFAIRNSTGVFDLSPMSKYRIRGPDAGRYVDRLVTRNLERLTDGRVAYVVWCDDAGHVIDDGTLFRLGTGDYRLCAQERHLDWLCSAALGFDVEVHDETGTLAALALQGPTSCATLRAMGLAQIETLAPFATRRFDWCGGDLLVSRTGYTGDLGYELWIAPAAALELWDALMQAGSLLGIRPIGSHALDVARIEAGFLQAWVDFVPAHEAVGPGRGRSPFELGLGWVVDLGKPVFNGRRALLAEHARGSRYRFVRLDVDGNKPARDAFIYNRRRQVVGTVTSAAWSPSTKRNIAFASLDMPWGRSGDDLRADIYYNRELQWKRSMARCRVFEGRVFDHPRRTAVPAPEF
ncbi:MAG: aminomethyltransferase family protein [Gammaproteobacteria bacterium]|nr:aminomethyltransferase family protein [Gammaproteobacteria bacterium]